MTAQRCDAEEDHTISPANPFLPAVQEAGETTDELTLQLLQHSVARRAPNYYNITNQV